MRTPTREAVAVLSMVLYTLAGFAVWWETTEISRPALPLHEMQSIQQDPYLYVAARRRPSLTFYLVAGDTSETQSTAREWLERMHVLLAKSMDVPLHEADQQLVLHAPGSCRLQIQAPAAASAVWRPGTCLSLPAPEDISSLEPAQLDASLENALSSAGGNWSLPGHTVLFLLPSAGTLGNGAPLQLVLGQHRHGWIRYPGGASGAKAALQALAHDVETLTAALMLKEGTQTVRRLPISGAGQLQLAFSLCNANSTSQPLTWDFDALEVGYLQAVVRALEPVAQVSISSQVLHYAPAAVQPAWSDVHSAHVVAHSQLPFFVDSHWNLHAVSTSFGSGTGASSGAATGAGASSVPAGAQCPADSAEDCSTAQPPPFPGAAAGSEEPVTEGPPAAGTARLPQGSEQQEVGSHISPHVLHFVVYVPPPEHRPLRVLLRNGSASPTNSFWIPSWGGVIVLNPPTNTLPPSAAAQARVQQLASSDLHHIAKVAVAQLHAQLGVPAHKPLPPASIAYDELHGSSGKAAVPRLQVAHLPAPRAGLAGWQVDALVRRATAANLVGAASKLGNLSALVQELPNLEMPQLIGDQVAAALSELRRAMRQAAAGSLRAAAVAARAARTHSEAAFFHPAVLAQFNFPDSHKLGIYMPFFLPVGAAILRSVARELSLARARWRATPGVAS